METCKLCGNIHGTRVDLKPAEIMDVDSFRLIQNKISCAKQAMSPAAIPDGVEESKVKLFVQAAIDSLANYQWMEKDLWDQMIVKYELPKELNVYIDFNTMMFYYFEE